MFKTIPTAKLALASFATILLALYSVSAKMASPAQARPVKVAYIQTARVEAKVLDSRAVILKDYLALKGSPLQDNAQDFIEAADFYGVDWKLLPAIAGVESTFGRFTPGSDSYPSHNAWGWGVYGTQAIYFSSWKEAIYTINQGLKQNYIDKGLTNPYQISTIYAASPTWGTKVSYFLEDLDIYAKSDRSAEKLGQVLSLKGFGQNQPSSAIDLPGRLASR